MSNRLDNEKVINEEYSLEKVINRPVVLPPEPAKDINVKEIVSRLDDDNDQAPYDMSFVDDEMQEKIVLSEREQKKENTFDDGNSSVISSDILSCLDSQNY